VAVLAFHGGFGWATGGYLGVSAFFTLSGFLITTLLLTEWRTSGRISLRRFWSRRLRRLMPAALVGLAGVVAFGALVADGDQLRELRGDVLAAMGYMANWRFMFSNQSYADLFAAPSPVLHFWSLAIEEQFYFCFPLAAVATLHRRRGLRSFFAVLLLAAASSVAARLLLLRAGASMDRLYYGTDTRVVELLVGALLAVGVARFGLPGHRAVCRTTQAVGALALLAMVGMWGSMSQSDRWVARGGLLVHAVLAAAVVLAAIQPHGPVRALLGRESLRRLGLISYGVYVYHWPIFLWLDGARTGLSRSPLFCLRVGVTLVVAGLSYHLLERPIREGRRFTAWHPWVFAPAAAGSVCLALVAVTAALPSPAIVYAAFSNGLPPRRSTSVPSVSVPASTSVSSVSSIPPASVPPVSKAPARPVRILVVGDSVGQTLGRGIERWAARTGAAVVGNAALGWCAIGRGGVIQLLNTGPVNQRGCVDWPARWRIERFRPDVVVVLSTLWEVAPRRQPEWDRVHRFGDPEYDRWLRSEYLGATAYLSSGGARVVWLTAPCASPAPSIARFWSDETGGLAAIARLNRLISSLPAAVAPARLQVVDLFSRVCPAGDFTPRLGDVEHARPDGLHFSDAGAEWVAEWLGPQLVDDAPSAPAPTTKHVS
jgi:peptidoglycan/LPS O-acetylase OafA/YrhL